MKTTITGYAHDGAGVSRIDGQVIFIPGALAEEEVEVEVIGGKKGVLRGRLLAVTKPSPFRTEPLCPVYYSCGGCSLQHIAYEEQLTLKKNILTEALARIGGLRDAEVLPVIGMEEPWRYRNKALFHAETIDGKLRLGFYAEGSHTLVPYVGCLLLSEAVSEILASLEEVLDKYQAKVFATDGVGLRYIIVRESSISGEVLISMLARGELCENTGLLAQELKTRFPQIAGITLEHETMFSGRVRGGKTEILLGEDKIEDRLGIYNYSISGKAFFQVNSSQAELLFALAVGLSLIHI